MLDITEMVTAWNTLIAQASTTRTACGRSRLAVPSRNVFWTWVAWKYRFLRIYKSKCLPLPSGLWIFEPSSLRHLFHRIPSIRFLLRPSFLVVWPISTSVATMSDEKRNDAVAAAPTTTQAETPDKPATASTGSTVADPAEPVVKDHAVPNGDIEKDNILHHEHTHSDEGSPDELKHKLTLHETIDLENKQAFKGDDSDGKIEWTFRKASHQHHNPGR